MRSFVLFTDYLIVRRSLPMLLSFVGIGFGVIRWNRYPRQSLMMIIAFSFYLIESWAAGLFFPESRLIDNFYAMLYFFEDFALAAVPILLFIAAFTGRRASPINN